MRDYERLHVQFVKEKATAALHASAGMVARRHMVAGLGTVKGQDDLYHLVLKADDALKALVLRCENVLSGQAAIDRVRHVETKRRP